jgi:hypothetical protein
MAAGAAAVAFGVPIGIVIEVTLALALTILAHRLLTTGPTVPDVFEAALAQHPPPPHDPHAALRRKVTSAYMTAADTHRILRPMLRDAAGVRLQRHGIDLDRDGQAATRALGPHLFDLVRPDRQRPDGDARPWTPQDLEDAIDRLERL